MAPRCFSPLAPLSQVGSQRQRGSHVLVLGVSEEVFLIVYVDDFKIAAKNADQDMLWKAVRAVIDMGEESEDGRFLGCDHQTFESTSEEVMELLQLRPLFYSRPIPGKKGRAPAEAGHDPNDVKYPDPKRKVVGKYTTYNALLADVLTDTANLPEWSGPK